MKLAAALTRLTQQRTVRAFRDELARRAELLKNDATTALAVVLPDGGRVDFGAAPRVALRIRDPSVIEAFVRPTLAKLADAFVQGKVDIEGSLCEAIPLVDRLVQATGESISQRPGLVRNRHTIRSDKEAVGYHYNVGNDFYRLWLDRRMIYSCAYFRAPGDSLDEAQRAKLDHICRKLRLSPGERFLDVGCGWGGLAIHAARHYGVSAVGITLAENQYECGRERVAELGLSDRVELHLLDYRELSDRFGVGAFDKVASVGMFEHVGLRRLPEYFGALAQATRDRGLFLNHGITSADVDNRPVGSGIGEFIERYVFPHGELPHLHLAVREMSASGFEVCDVEGLRPHYSKTLEQWSGRLEAQLDAAARLVPDSALRIWRAYLAGCSHAFSQGWVNIYQILGSRQIQPGATELPMTRDWIYR